MSFQGSASATFDLYPLRFRPVVGRARPRSANTLRGAFGAALKQTDEAAYERYFAPQAKPGTGPSGFANPPRPFVFRFTSEFRSEFESDDVGLNLFLTRDPPIDLFTGVMNELGFVLVEAPRLTCLSLEPPEKPISRIRVRFLTPTDLGESARFPRSRMEPVPPEPSGAAPDFGILARRIRDRTSTLRSLYGAGPLEIDFKAFGECADTVRLVHCEITHVNAERVSKATGQRHSLGGFTGIAEYEGSMAMFLPYLEAARFTGVGRQTVWGKGEIVVEAI